jgi:NADH-quinone oxidoreductase subunit C/D
MSDAAAPLPPPLADLQARFGPDAVVPEDTVDGIPTAWVPASRVRDMVRHLKLEIDRPYRMLFDLTGVDERLRTHKSPCARDFTVLYHLLSFDRNADVRLKVALSEARPHVPTISDVWEMANWYEREAWDMFGVQFDGHPNLSRILMPRYWVGHPLRKDHPARATEMEPFRLDDARQADLQESLRFRPEEWGLRTTREDHELLFLNVGPHHPGTHGVLRIVVALDGEVIVDAVPEIGFHHRAAEKMGERQTWHTYIPYTDRVDYLAGVNNNLPYVMAVERLAGIQVPERAQVIRVMMCELFRIASHLVWYGTFAQDLGALSPVFYMFTDREHIMEMVEAFCGGRLHPSWFRVGGTAQDLPVGWEKMVADFLDYMPARLRDYDKMVMGNRIFKLRSRNIGKYTLEDAIEWGVTGPNLRCCGLAWDFRKARPYSGYEQFEFDIPTAEGGDCYARAEVRVEEIRQSLRIIRQCLENMPEGDHKADHPVATPPRKERTMHDIETLIHHFLNVSWGPVVPAGEAMGLHEAPKGANGYHLISDGSTHPYRLRIRAPSFAHMQMLPKIARGLMIPDLLAILGAMDFVLADVDR